MDSASDIVVSALGLGVIALWLRALVDRACARTPALGASRRLLYQLTGLWVATAFLKLVWLDELIPPLDGNTHEYYARIIADHLNSGEFEQAFWYFGALNDGYRFLVGAFYALTGAPRGIVYGINGGLAFWGLLSLLETTCRASRASRVSNWLVLLMCASPSALFWTTANLKEGPMLWAICMMLRLATRSAGSGERGGLILPLVGVAVMAFFRPHIGAAWLGAIGLGVALREMRASIAVASVAGVMGAVVSLNLAMPDLFESFAEQGVTTAMEDRYNRRSEIGGSAIQYTRGAPIPVVDGLLLILLRPYPTEVFDVASLLSGAEIWLITGLCLLGWLRAGQRWKLLLSSSAITQVTAILILSFFFTYLYNMGLVVRQRLQVFPAMLTLLAVPYLASHAAARSRPAIARTLPLRTVRSHQLAPRAARGAKPLPGAS